MSEQQKQLVEEILGSSKEMSEAYQQRLIGVAYGLELAQGMAVNASEKQQQQK
ncbi:hypothetical protein [Angelakisella massiliensis]|uniref:hypothetical protein n=1 Tax=Angelakisella massiliensis TaxID=1871018 RepID=UPI0023A7F853|nr:hypothetical protein [Angelakisella massiliensis]